MATAAELIASAKTNLGLGTEAGLADAIRQLKSAAGLAAANQDYATAIDAALAAKAVVALMPDSVRGGSAGTELTWDRGAIDTFVTQMRRGLAGAQGGGSGIQTVEVTYETEDDLVTTY